MVPLPKLPNLPDPENVFSVIDKTGDALDKGLDIIEKVFDKFDRATYKIFPPEERPTQSPARAPETPKEPSLEGEPVTTTPKQETVATACVACALGHFSTSAGLLNELVRFKKEGITSNEVLDRIAKTLEELNTLERVDLTPEKIRSAPDWERDIAEEALQQSRSLRHRLETIKTMADLEAAAADTEGYYRRLNREWWKRRLAQPGELKPELTLEDARKLAAEEAEREVERRWSQEKK